MNNFKKMLILFAVFIFFVILAGLYFLGNRSFFGGSVLQENIENKKENSALPKNNLLPKKNSEGSVEITVTPKDLSESAKTWDFEISLDTHTEELKEDLVSVSVLSGGDGKEYKPIFWDGMPPGGHHRSGVLKFNPISPPLKLIKLKIIQIGGVNERIFEWEL